jgi:hypothetical protein
VSQSDLSFVIHYFSHCSNAHLPGGIPPPSSERDGIADGALVGNRVRVDRYEIRAEVCAIHTDLHEAVFLRPHQ